MPAASSARRARDPNVLVNMVALQWPQAESARLRWLSRRLPLTERLNGGAEYRALKWHSMPDWQRCHLLTQMAEGLGGHPEVLRLADESAVAVRQTITELLVHDRLEELVGAVTVLHHGRLRIRLP
jgi:hypothetical protein